MYNDHKSDHFLEQKKSNDAFLSLSGSRPSGAPMSKVALALESVTVDFNNIRALENVNFEINKGEVVFITGASGAGKTTLMKVLGGWLQPRHGRFISNLKPGELIAPIFQDLHLNDHHSIEKNLLTSFDTNLYPSKKEFENDVQDFAKILGIYDRMGIKVKDANGGLKQKAAFLRAMLAKPSVVLADEPTASLDYDNAKKIFDILSLYHSKQGLTVVWASHNKDLVKRFHGRIVHLDRGRIIHSGHACFI
jgi:ABC-type lipoprotein export system ATPase subunit